MVYSNKRIFYFVEKYKRPVKFCRIPSELWVKTTAEWKRRNNWLVYWMLLYLKLTFAREVLSKYGKDFIFFIPNYRDLLRIYSLNTTLWLIIDLKGLMMARNMILDHITQITFSTFVFFKFLLRDY